MKNPETIIEDYFNEQVFLHGGFVRKYRSPGRRGVPDRIMFMDGVCFVEIKTEIGELDPLQTLEILKIISRKGEAAVLRSKTDVDNFMEAWLNGERNVVSQFGLREAEIKRVRQSKN